MEVRPYNDDEGKKNQIARMFDNIAPRYDFLNHFLSLGIDKIWRKRALRELSAVQPKNVLDVATGTADVAIATVKSLDPDRVVGIDISNEMLDVGRKKINNLQLQDTITLRLGDAENLPFEDNTFDAITVAFGVRNFENLEKGLEEMYRVLKKDGKLIVLEFSKPKIFPFKQLFNFYFKNVLPIIGKMTSKDPKAYQYLYESVQAFPEGEAFEQILLKTGYQSCKNIALTLGICSIYTGLK